MPTIPSPQRSPLTIIVLVTLILISGIALRSLFLCADPPKDITISGGIIGDPGQYQYGARNQVLFGQTSLDGYTPHLLSPLIHPLNTLVYSWFGISLTTHRIIPLLFGSLILIVFWAMLRRLLDDPICAITATAFLAFSYPLIAYSHVAYREYPMTFFFLLSLWAFAKGAHSNKLTPFAVSALLFFLSYLSKGSGIFLIIVFAGAGLIWLMEKRVNWRQLATFVTSLSGVFLIWWFAIYKTNPVFFDIFLADNRNVRRVGSLSAILDNLWGSPMMLVLRNDPVLFMVAGLTLWGLIRTRFSKPRTLPPIIDLAVAWLFAGSFFHGVVNYRPTRFYLMLVLPLALIAGYGLSGFLKERAQTARWTTLPAMLILPFILVAMGFPAYFKQLNRWTGLQILLHVSVLILLVLLLLFRIRPRQRVILVSLLVFLSLACNGDAYLRWVKQRQYEMPAIIDVLNNAIPPTRIAGNWASHLSIGTPHRTFYAWKGFFNWQSDFLARNRIEYLLLARSRTFDEISDYRVFFQEEWSRSQLMADFELHNARVHLYRILPKPQADERIETGPETVILEMEALQRSSGLVRYNPQASQQMVVVVSKQPQVDFSLRETLSKTISGLSISACGRFSLQVRRGEQALTRILVNTPGSQLQEINRIFDPPLVVDNETVHFIIEPLDISSPVLLDRITLTAHSTTERE